MTPEEMEEKIEELTDLAEKANNEADRARSRANEAISLLIQYVDSEGATPEKKAARAEFAEELDRYR